MASGKSLQVESKKQTDFSFFDFGTLKWRFGSQNSISYSTKSSPKLNSRSSSGNDDDHFRKIKRSWLKGGVIFIEF